MIADHLGLARAHCAVCVVFERTRPVLMIRGGCIYDGAGLGLDYNAFTPTDNTCKPAPPLRVTKVSDLDTLLDDVRAVERGVVNEVEKEVKEVEMEVLSAEREVVKDFKLLEQTLEDDLVSFSRGFTVFKDQVRLAVP